MLVNSSLRVGQIVDRAGFSSQTYFNRSFKRRFGVSPAAYRRQQKMESLTKTNPETPENS
ncbi:MAG: helix-turn-helix domain-containing protein [Lachnospiraceae bacterium]